MKFGDKFEISPLVILLILMAIYGIAQIIYGKGC